jgi:hypothetical protein
MFPHLVHGGVFFSRSYIVVFCLKICFHVLYAHIGRKYKDQYGFYVHGDSCVRIYRLVPSDSMLTTWLDCSVPSLSDKLSDGTNFRPLLDVCVVKP